MPLNLSRILDAILPDYALPLDGEHGVAHWARVLENGLRLCERTAADAGIVQLFAIFHDARRINEHHDPQHGLRGAELAKSLHGELFELNDDDLEVLLFACEHHTDMADYPHETIRVCWDADRLDLGRVGISPDPRLLCTPAARDPEMMNWSHGRASFQIVPPRVLEEWGINLSSHATP